MYDAAKELEMTLIQTIWGKREKQKTPFYTSEYIPKPISNGVLEAVNNLRNQQRSAKPIILSRVITGYTDP
jgi:hypothetical protein